MTPRRGIAVLALVLVFLPPAPVRADDAEDKAVAVITKVGGSVTRDARAKGNAQRLEDFASQLVRETYVL